MNANATHPFETNLDRHPSNYIPLSPVSFLTRAASAFADKIAVIDRYLKRGGSLLIMADPLFRAGPIQSVTLRTCQRVILISASSSYRAQCVAGTTWHQDC